jgi:hypothetical protein
MESFIHIILHMIEVGPQQSPELVLAHDPGPPVSPFQAGVMLYDMGLRKWPLKTSAVERQQLNWPAMRTDAVLYDHFSEEATRDLPNCADQLKINIGRLAEVIK